MKKNVKFDHSIVDGIHFKPIIPIDNNNEDNIISYECIPKADNTYLNVAAASIVAKDFHDNEILKLVEENKDLLKYDLNNNMGYATLKHREAIKKYGIHSLHRKTFASCKN